MDLDLSIVIPAFNEEQRIPETLRKVLTYIPEREPNSEFIVVDDGSTDQTAKVALEECEKFPEIKTQVIRYEENRGKGYAVRTGFAATKGKIALFSDADLSTPIEEYNKLIVPIQTDFVDVAIGSRALDRTLIGERQPWRREQGGKVFNFFVRSITRLPYWDTQCGFKAFNMKKFAPLLPLMKIDRFGFDVEFLYVAKENDLRLTEIPVRWNNDDRTKVNIFRDSSRMFNEVRQIRSYAKRGFYSPPK